MSGQPPFLTQDDVWTLFLLIDVDASGRVDIEEFVSGCMQLRGPAQSLQVAKMSRLLGEFWGLSSILRPLHQSRGLTGKNRSNGKGRKGIEKVRSPKEGGEEGKHFLLPSSILIFA